MTLGNYIANIQTDIPWLPGWLIAVTLFFALLAAGFALQYLIMKVLARYHVGKSPLSQSVFRRTKAVVRYAFCLLAVKIALPLVPLPAEAAQAVHNLTAAAFVVLLGWIMIIATNTIADRYALRLKLDGDDTLLVRKAVTQIRILRRAAGTLIILVTIGLALMNFESVRHFRRQPFCVSRHSGVGLRPGRSAGARKSSRWHTARDNTAHTNRRCGGRRKRKRPRGRNWFDICCGPIVGPPPVNFASQLFLGEAISELDPDIGVTHRQRVFSPRLHNPGGPDSR